MFEKSRYTQTYWCLGPSCLYVLDYRPGDSYAVIRAGLVGSLQMAIPVSTLKKMVADLGSVGGEQ